MTIDPGNEKGGTGWIITYTGTRIEPLNPDPNSIDTLDIAHALSNMCRFTGHVKEFYSVAQHSYLVSTIVPEEDALWGLMHDASEAYLADIARPIKMQKAFGSVYRKYETKLMEAVCDRYGLSHTMPDSVAEADTMLLRAEQRDLMSNDPSPGDIYGETIVPWPPSKAKSWFLNRYSELTGDLYEGYYPKEARGMGTGKLWKHVGALTK